MQVSGVHCLTGQLQGILGATGDHAFAVVPNNNDLSKVRIKLAQA